MVLKHKISNDLSIPVTLIETAIKGAYSKVKHLEFRKRNGEKRIILQPSRNLKVLQYWLINNVFGNLKVHSSATAYRKNYSVKDNAIRHKNNRYFLKLDFESFFPSIKFQDFRPLISDWHKTNSVDWILDVDAEDLIKKACFYRKDTLPIGYPSSPTISNAVMFNFDAKLNQIFSLEKEKYGNVVYTRYADDLVFSTNKAGASNGIFDLIKEIIEQLPSPHLKLNGRKTRFSSRSGGSAFITGLRICRDGHLTIHRKYKDHIRLLLSLLKKDLLNKNEYVSLKGHVSYIKHVDPAFYNKLQRKHFDIIEKL